MEGLDVAPITLEFDPMLIVLVVLYLWRAKAQERNIASAFTPKVELEAGLQRLIEQAARNRPDSSIEERLRALEKEG